jgi:hypothetical protein
MRTVLKVEVACDADATRRLMVRVAGATTMLRELRLPTPFPPQPPTPASVGNALRTSLIATDPSIGNALMNLANPLFFEVSAPDAELISWEALLDDANQHFALSKPTSIGRMCDQASSANPRPPPELTLPVRMVVVFSAFEHRQLSEWRRLHAALHNAEREGLALAVEILVADPDHRTMIENAVRKNPCTLVTVEVAPLPASAQGVIQAIRARRPNILHISCHGRMSQAEQLLELAKPTDYLDQNAKSGSICISTREFCELAEQLEQAWLLVLNCCSTAQATPGLHSMGKNLAVAGFPAVIAMTQAIAESDACILTEMFYSDLFHDLHVADISGKTRIPFDWASPTVSARRAIQEHHALHGSDEGQWALPVVYARGRESFEFVRRVGPSQPTLAQLTSARVVASWMRSVLPEANDEPNPTLRNSKLDQIQKIAIRTLRQLEVPKDLWPNGVGSFS